MTKCVSQTMHKDIRQPRNSLVASYPIVILGRRGERMEGEDEVRFSDDKDKIIFSYDLLCENLLKI